MFSSGIFAIEPPVYATGVYNKVDIIYVWIYVQTKIICIKHYHMLKYNILSVYLNVING